VHGQESFKKNPKLLHRRQKIKATSIYISLTQFNFETTFNKMGRPKQIIGPKYKFLILVIDTYMANTTNTAVINSCYEGNNTY